MAREKKQIILDEEAIKSNDLVQTRVPIENQEVKQEEEKEDKVIRFSKEEENLVNCLRNEKIIVKFVPRARGMVSDPKHILYGGMAEGAKIHLSTPALRTGGYVDVLTKNEKRFLEYKLGLEPNALSVHNRVNNFWSDANPQGIGRITLTKGDNILDLSNPLDYIKYKVLLANKDIIAPSVQELQDRPKATYKFVIVNNDNSMKTANAKVTLKAQAYMEYGKINDNKDKMKVIIETIDGRPVAANSKLEYLQGKLGEIIESNTKIFLQVVKDPLLDTKVLIKKAIEAGIIANRGNYLYMKDNNTPLCENGQEPTFGIAARYLNLPKNQELKFSIEARING